MLKNIHFVAEYFLGFYDEINSLKKLFVLLFGDLATSILWL